MTTTRANDLVNRKDKPMYVEIDKKRNEIVKKHHQPRRRLEFNKAGFFYLSDLAKYVSTHFKANLDLHDSLYVKMELFRETFFDIILGEFRNQYERLMKEINRAANQKCYVPSGKSTFYIMQPFIVAYENTDPQKLPELERKRLANISQDNDIAKKIETIHFYFAKPIFEEYILGVNKQYYRHPSQFYARIYDSLSRREGMDINQLTSTTFVNRYIRVIEYMYQHGAGDPRKGRLQLNLGEMLAACTPEYIHREREGYIRKRKVNEAIDFYTAAVMMCNEIDGLDFKITKYGFSNDGDWIILGLEHPYAPKSKLLHAKK